MIENEDYLFGRYILIGRVSEDYCISEYKQNNQRINDETI